MRIILCGWSRHGKGEVSDILEHHFGLRSQSSSKVSRFQVFENSPLLQGEWRSPDQAWENRHYNREEWYKQIQRINTPDKTELAKMVYSAGCRVYDGMRDIDELHACRDKWPELWVVWIKRPDMPAESSRSNTITEFDCDFTLTNAGDLRSLERKVKRVFSRVEGI